MVLALLLLIGVLYLWWQLNKRIYKVSNNSVICFTGGLGSGKTLFGVYYALGRLAKRRRSYKIKQFFRKRFNYVKYLVYKDSEPLLYSNIPIRSKHYVNLTQEHITLERKINENSVVFLDEIGQVASQHDWNKPLVKGNINEYIRFFRHYIDGSLIVTDQSADEIAVGIRRRINVIYNLNDFVKLLPIPYFTIARTTITPVTIIENLQTVEKTDVGEIDKHFIYAFLIGKPRYASRTYKHRYDHVTLIPENPQYPDSLYTNDFIEIPDKPLQNKKIESQNPLG
jgi:hypothetical protein